MLGKVIDWLFGHRWSYEGLVLHCTRCGEVRR